MSLKDKSVKNFRKHVKTALMPLEKPLDRRFVQEMLAPTADPDAVAAFWDVSIRELTAVKNCFTTWKFCDLLHILLREGNQLMLLDCLQHKHRKQILRETAAYWNFQSGHLSHCIATYCRMLLKKLQFHESYPFFAGNLDIATQQIWSIELCFQLCLDVMNLLEELLTLQEIIFTNVPRWKLAHRKCRMFPLSNVVAECDALYHHAVELIHKLNIELPSDDMIGYHQRFQVIFKNLKKFFERVGDDLWMKEIVQIPQLPDVPPTINKALYPDLMKFEVPTAPSESELNWDW